MEWKDWWQEVWRQSPAMALLIAIIATGFFQYWVWGSTYKEMKADRDEYRQIAFQSTGLLEKNVGINTSIPTPTPTPTSSPASSPAPSSLPTSLPTPQSTVPSVPEVKAQVIDIRKRLNMLEAKASKQ
jgi:hypothetical protein